MSEIFNQINSLDLNELLNSLGHFGKRYEGYTTYKSPLREDRAPSFSVFIYNEKYRWKDHGLMDIKSGTVVDFLSKYYGWSLSQLKREYESGTILNGFSFFPKPNTHLVKACEKEKKHDIRKKYTYEVSRITSSDLVSYLNSRGLNDITVWENFLSELHVNYGSYQQVRYIGFKNDFGGWAVRNEKEKRHIGQQGYSYLKSNKNVPQKTLLIFEGSLDMISFLHIQKHFPDVFKSPNIDFTDFDILVANSVNNLIRAEIIKSYTLLIGFIDQRENYYQFSDVNDWLKNLNGIQ